MEPRPPTSQILINSNNLNPDKIIRKLGHKSFSRNRDFLKKLIAHLDPDQLKECFRAVIELLMQDHLHHMVRMDGLALYRVLSEKAPESLWHEVSGFIESKLDNPDELYLASQLLSPKMMPLFRTEIQENIYRYLLDQLKKGEIEQGVIKGGEPAKCLIHLRNILPDYVKEEVFVILCQGLFGRWWHEGFCVRCAIELADVFTDRQSKIIVERIVIAVIEKNSFSARDELEFYIDKLPLPWYPIIIEALKKSAADEHMQSDAIYWLDKIGKNHSLNKKMTEKAHQAIEMSLSGDCRAEPGAARPSLEP